MTVPFLAAAVIDGRPIIYAESHDFVRTPLTAYMYDRHIYYYNII